MAALLCCPQRDSAQSVVGKLTQPWGGRETLRVSTLVDGNVLRDRMPPIWRKAITMKTPVNRQTVDLSAYPDLVVIYLGMKVRTISGIITLFRHGPLIDKAGAGRPAGLLHFENNIVFSLFPLHLGMRWYWKDFESMEQWARSDPHRIWWQRLLRSSGGTSFWHETYFMRGGMEAIYDDVTKPLGFQAFAPSSTARGPMFSARHRLGKSGDTPTQPDGVAEKEIY